jgi:hypothetical protein
MDAISQIWRIRRWKNVEKCRGDGRNLRNVEECQVPKETEAMKELGTPAT